VVSDLQQELCGFGFAGIIADPSRFTAAAVRFLILTPIKKLLAAIPAQYCHQGPYNKVLSDRGGIGRQPRCAVSLHAAHLGSKYLHRFCVVQPQKQTLHGFDVVSRQHRFRNRKKLTNKVEVRIVRHSPVTLLPQLGAPLGSAYMLRGAYEKVRVDQAWSCGRDAHLSVRCIRRRRCVRRTCLSAPSAPASLCL